MHRVALSDIDHVGGNLQAARVHLLDGLLRPARADVEHGDASAFVPQPLGNRAADAARRAGDHRNAAFESLFHSLLSWVAVLRP